MATIAIVGGGFCGLGAALLLGDDGHAVSVYERDLTPVPDSPAAASEWRRRGVTQYGLAHFLQARGSRIMRESLREVYDLIDAHGGLHYNFVAEALKAQPEAGPKPGDDRFDQMTGRRSTLEWALASAAAAHPSVIVHRGMAVEGVTVSGTHVTGLGMADGSTVTADLILDASGRRSPTARWLAEAGAPVPPEQIEEAGSAYYSRYFASSDGAMPEMRAPLLTAMGSFAVLSLPADNGTYSLTLYGRADDAEIRRFKEPEVYERVLRACPDHAHWLYGKPITELTTMSGITGRRRSPVVDGRPVVTGLVSLGDAAMTTDPARGRGMTLALLQAEALREAIGAGHDDPADQVIDFDRRLQAEVGLWFDDTISGDRRSLARMAAHAAGEVPELTAEDRITDVISAGAFSDPVAARVLGDVMGLNALGTEVLGRPGMFEHILKLAEDPSIASAPQIPRADLLELIG